MPVKVILLDNYVQLNYLGSNDILQNYDKGCLGFISISPLCLISKTCTHINIIKIMTIRIKKVIRTDQWIVFIFIWKLFNRVELRTTVK